MQLTQVRYGRLRTGGATASDRSRSRLTRRGGRGAGAALRLYGRQWWLVPKRALLAQLDKHNRQQQYFVCFRTQCIKKPYSISTISLYEYHRQQYGVRFENKAYQPPNT